MSQTSPEITVLRLRDSATLRPAHVVMICIVLATLAGCSLLLSAGESLTPVDGAIPWSTESPLRAVVQLLCLNYSFPTIHAGDVKGYILGLGTGLSLLALGLAIAIRSPSGSDDAAAEAFEGQGNTPGDSMSPGAAKVHIQPLFAAQGLFLVYLVWSYVSASWSAAPRLALGASFLLTVQFLWAIVIAYGLGPRAARVVARGVMIIAVVTSLFALWYFYGRNPSLRAKFPSGNPNFLAASLVPGIFLLLPYLGEKLAELRTQNKNRAIIQMIMGLVGLGLTVWALMLTSSRGVQLGIGFGTIAILFFGLRGSAKVLPIILMILLAISTSFFYAEQADAPSLTGRSATQRLRGYAWSYAWRMFDEKPLIGHGQAGYVLNGDAYAINDVQTDPQALETRIANAHNEWFQVLSELGSVGLVLVIGALALTLLAGATALSTGPPLAERNALLGSMGALIALCVSECFGVGLRVADVPPFFYATLGLVWAFSLHRMPSPIGYLSRSSIGRVVAAVVGLAASLLVILLSQEDFNSARYAYQVTDELDAGRFDEAIDLAERATHSLNPERSLANLRQLARAHLHAASKYQAGALDRESRARAGEFLDERLLVLAAEDRERCDRHARAGMMVVKELVQVSPDYFNHGRVLYELGMILAQQAVARGDDAQRDQYLRDAAEALKREIQRQPFDPAIAVEYIRTTAGTLELPVVLEHLARPLRYAQLPSNYSLLLQPLAADPEFETNFSPIRSRAEARCANPMAPVPDAEPVDNWSPEVLRLAAAIRVIVGDFEEAARLLKLAASFYKAISGEAPVAAAATMLELSNAQFLHSPDNPSEAIQSATLAIKLAPPSLDGRRIVSAAKQRLVEMKLAAGDEAQAAGLLRELAVATVADDAVNREMGSRYARLAYRLLQRPVAGVLPKPAAELKPTLEQWTRRACELNPEDYLGHYLAADFAFLGGDDQAAADHLRKALANGLDPAVARQFLDVARQQKPESEPMRLLENEMNAAPAQPGLKEPVPLPRASSDTPKPDAD